MVARGKHASDGSTEPDVTSDYLRFLLLSGCRSIEAKGGEYAKGLRVADVDLVAARLKLAVKHRGDQSTGSSACLTTRRLAT